MLYQTACRSFLLPDKLHLPGYLPCPMLAVYSGKCWAFAFSSPSIAFVRSLPRLFYLSSTNTLYPRDCIEKES